MSYAVLIVDDSETRLQALASELRAEGDDVVLARSGEEALERLAVGPVDCVLLDVLMPGLGSYETCRRIKESPGLREVPLIMLTALEDRDTMLQALAGGADDYVARSSDFEVLRSRMNAQIRRRRFEEQNRRFREHILQMEIEAAEARAARELAETRTALIAELERKNRELEAFSYSVSHDLRAPLRAIDGFSQALLEDCAPLLDEKGRHYLQRVRAASRRMGELIDDLLQLSRISRAELRPEPLDLTALALAVGAELVKAAPERCLRLTVAEGLSAVADPRLVRVALDNLLGNAWKFTATRAEAVIEVGTTAGAVETVYFVRDNGVGFDMKHAGKLFSPFQRLHAVTEFPGTGIGLSIVHRIIDRHGGRIWAEAELDRGAAFFWTLPSPEGGGS